jgi:hypothetical protein
MEIDDAIAKARARTLMAAKIFSRLMAEFEGDVKYCAEAMTEVMDAADQLNALENAKYLQSHETV